MVVKLAIALLLLAAAAAALLLWLLRSEPPIRPVDENQYGAWGV